MPERDKIDELIDSALASYAEPRVGLEQRVVARVAADAGRSWRSGWRRGWLVVAIATPVLAAAIFILYLAPKAHQVQGPSQVASTSTGASTGPSTRPSVGRVVTEPMPHVVESSGSSHRIRRRDQDVDERTNHAVPQPKKDIFPTPQPMTAEEQALSHFATEASEADRKGLIEAQQRVEEPLNISAINIAPLKSLEDKQN